MFWPYAYSDIFDYAFWPDGYDVGYWDYAYDDFIDGLFWGEQGPPAEYVEARRAGFGSRRAAGELCRRAGTLHAARQRHHRLAVRRHQRKVGLNAEQKSLLDDVRSAATKRRDRVQGLLPGRTTPSRSRRRAG